MSGSGGDVGYDYQADAAAYIAAHAVAGKALSWFDSAKDIPTSWLLESDGPGEDIRVLMSNAGAIEVQAKHALHRGEEFNQVVQKFVTALENSADLRCVLLVDRHTSQTITNDIKHDLVRISEGRTDKLKKPTRELLQQLGRTPSQLEGILARLRIIVVDLDEGSDGVAAAEALLSKVVAKEKSGDAYKLLGKRYHRLIKRYSKDTIFSCAGFLRNSVGLSENSSPALATTRFNEFVHRTSSDFYCPALEARFPIANAWNEVASMQSSPKATASTLAKEIRRYQEWTRLTRTSDRIDALSAESFLSVNSRVVIVGGPGSGKTTLARRLANYFSADMLVVWVRLPLLLALLKADKTFESSLMQVAIESSSESEANAAEIVGSADILIFDGLDECDPNRADVAMGICRWASSHPNAKICVLTRPVGHSPELLPGFVHGELLPLDDSGVRRFAGLMLASQREPQEASRLLARFLESIKSKATVASIASRNPLLLSFLVRLFVDGQSIEGNRVALFERIVEQIRRSPLSGRMPARDPLDYATMWAAAEIVGWSCTEKADRALAQIYKLIADRFGGTLGDLRRAEEAVSEWTERGLLERITIGSFDALIFAHLALGEYFAACFLAGLDHEKFTEAVRRYRNKPQWHEPILMSGALGQAELLIDTLVGLDRPENPESREAMLAASAVSEVLPGKVTAKALSSIVNRLSERIRSNIPVLAVDAGLAFLEVVHEVPDLAASMALELWDHDQPWTQLVASCVGLAGGSRSIEIARVLAWLQRVSPAILMSFGRTMEGMPEGTHDLQKAALGPALRRVAVELPPGDAENVIKSFLKKHDLSIAMMEAVQESLSEEPYRTWVEQSRQKDHQDTIRDMVQRMSWFEEHSKRSKEVMLKAILSACGARRDENTKCPCGYALIGTLLSSMGMMEAIAGDFASAGIESSDLLPELFRGWIAGLHLNPNALAGEVNCLLNSSADLLDVPRVKRDLNSAAVQGAALDLRLLGRAMQHPSWFVAQNAAQLFLLSQSEQRQDVLQVVLDQGKDRSLALAGFLAKEIWREKAFEKLHARITAKLTSDCRYLYKHLVRAAAGESQLQTAIECALAGVGSDNPRVAEKAAEALRECDAVVLKTYTSRFSELIEHWTERGSWCETCNIAVYGTSCEKCHVVPPDPRRHLVYLLFKTGSLSFSDLSSFAKQNGFGIAEESQNALIEMAFADPEEMHNLIVELENGRLTTEVVDALLSRPVDRLRTISDKLSVLLKSRSGKVRARVVRSLTAGWLDRQAALAWANSALKDDDPQVRSAAATVLREAAELSL